jgi:hypothetical protein
VDAFTPRSFRELTAPTKPAGRHFPRCLRGGAKPMAAKKAKKAAPKKKAKKK